MNTYRYQFVTACPVNGKEIRYALEIKTTSTIMVEDILDACNIEAGFHEAIADLLYSRFGGVQTMTAHHHGVDIETVRG